MENTNLWGQLPSIDNIRTPIQILQEQASWLGKMTSGALVARVKNYQTPGSLKDQFYFALVIIAPALNDYTVEVLVVNHPLHVYPVKIIADIAKNTVKKKYGNYLIECHNDNDFVDALALILNSPEVNEIIKSLLLHTKSISTGII